MVAEGYYATKAIYEANKRMKVTEVRTMVRKGKSKRVGRNRVPGRTSDWKRAVVTLADGNTIEMA